MKPSVGRMVHYTPGDVFHAGQTWAAIVTEVLDDAGLINLTIFSPGHTPFPLTGISSTSEQAGTKEARGCWSWPTFVKPVANPFNPHGGAP